MTIYSGASNPKASAHIYCYLGLICFKDAFSDLAEFLYFLNLFLKVIPQNSIRDQISDAIWKSPPSVEQDLKCPRSSENFNDKYCV